MKIFFGGVCFGLVCLLVVAGCGESTIDDGTDGTAVTAFTVFRSTGGLANDAVTDVAVDYLLDGVWVSTLNGISFYSNPDSVIYTYGAEYDIPNMKVMTIAVDYTGIVWAGTETGPTTKSPLDSTWTALADTDSLVNRFVTAIRPMRDFSVWIGTKGGVSVKTLQGWRSYTTELGSSSTVTSITQDSSGAVWIGTTIGVAVLDGQSWKHYGSTVLPNEYVNTVFSDGTGRVWCGTAFTMAVYDGSGWKTYGAAQGLTAYGVYDYALDSDGVLWAGTDNGLFYLSGSTWKKLPLPQDVEGAVVRALACDLRSNILWIATDSGLVRFIRT